MPTPPENQTGWAQLEALNQITLAINATLDLDHIFATIEREAKKLIDFDRLSFALFDPRRVGQMRVYATALPDREAVIDTRVPLRGRIAEVLEHHRAILVDDLDPGELDAADVSDAALIELGVRSMVCLPLIAKGELLGSLNLGARKVGAYKPSDLPLLKQIAAQLAIAIEKARLFSEEKKRVEQLKLLNDVAKEVVSSLDGDAMLRRVVDLVLDAFEFDHLSCFLYDETDRMLRLAAVAGRWADKVDSGWAISVERGVLGQSVRQARPYLAEDTSRDPHYVLYPGIDSKTELAVPIVARGTVLGCMNAESHIVNAFDAKDVQTLTTIADQIASGLINANLYSEVSEFNAVLEKQVQEKTRELLSANKRIAQQKDLLSRENVNLRETLKKDRKLIGDAKQLRALLLVIDKVAPTDASVLIQGESGTGKELVAARIHALSTRRDGAHVSINCGALPGTLLESELFGHEAGAFTGADRQKQGLVETAEGGTLFLDEIAELPLPLQAKLLRFLENGEYYRVGGKKTLQSNARILSATNRDLRNEVAIGEFREDLLFRINTITLEVPPLRERLTDIPKLARFFLDQFKRGRQLAISDQLMTALTHYQWPGNVRELANLMERLAILGDEGELGLDYVPNYIIEGAAVRPPTADPNTSTGIVQSLKELERDHIVWALRKNRGDKTRTSRELGISLKTLYNKLSRYKL